MKHDGWRVGPRDVLEKLEDPSQADDVDPKTYSFRVYISMECGDQRYLHLNTGMWIASGLRKGTEGEFRNWCTCRECSMLTGIIVIYDAYRVT